MGYGKEIHEAAIELFDRGFGYKLTARFLGIKPRPVRDWLYTYRAVGKEALLVTTHKKYSTETKLAAVRDFVENGLSKPEVMKKYGIVSLNSLKVWIRQYKAGGEEALKPNKPGRPKKEPKVYATREEELEARIAELELENEILKRINALIEEFEREQHPH